MVQTSEVTRLVQIGTVVSIGGGSVIVGWYLRVVNRQYDFLIETLTLIGRGV